MHLLLLLLAAGVYLVHSDGPFIYDDLPFIVENEDLRRLWPPDWLRLRGGDHAQVNSRPLLSLTLALNYWLGGLQVQGYHLVNVLLHCCCGVVLYGVLRQLWRRVDALAEKADALALCTTVFWILHPLNSEVVYYVSQRSATLMGIFYLATLYGFLRGLHGSRVWSVVAVLCCGLGMAAKEVMVSAPLVILLCEWALSSGHRVKHVKEIGGILQRRPWFYGGLAATWLVLLRGLWVGPHGTAIGFGLGVGVWTYLLNQCQIITAYLTRVFWPHPLILDYGLPQPLGVGDIWLEGVFVLGLLGLSGWAWGRWPLWGWAGMAFFLLLAPTSSLVPNLTEVGAERRMYLPLILCLGALVIAADRVFTHLKTKGWQIAVLVGLVSLLLGWATIRRGADFASAVSIWETAVTAMPENARAHLNLGTAVQGTGDLIGAAAHYRRALALQPTMAEGYFNLGSALQQQGDWQGAERSYRQALALKPDYAKADLNLGQVKKEQGDPLAAERHYRRALVFAPRSSGAVTSLGKLFFAQGHYDSAAVYFRRALVLQPDLAEGYNSIGTVLAMQKNYAAALVEYRRALELDPGYQRARENIAKISEVLDKP